MSNKFRYAAGIVFPNQALFCSLINEVLAFCGNYAAEFLKLMFHKSPKLSILNTLFLRAYSFNKQAGADLLRQFQSFTLIYFQIFKKATLTSNRL